MNNRLSLRIALILLILMLVIPAIYVSAQDTAPENTATPEATATATVEVTSTANMTLEATPEATATVEVTAEPTEAVTVDVAGVPPSETGPVAGVSNENEGQLSSGGVVTGVLLVGLAAVFVVVGRTLMRGNTPKE